MTDDSIHTLTWTGRIARGLAILLFGYWILFALLTPVTVWDAHVYNLGRLPLSELGGLWSNPFWTSERQVFFPLTFDAIHLPLLHLGAGFALPSFLCFVGLAAIVWSTLRRWHNADAAWLGVLALLALPTLVYQAVVTKNDLAVLFGLAVWFHAIARWQREPARRHLFIAAIAIGFMAGSKSSGVPLGLLCSLATFWLLRHQPKLCGGFLAVLAGSLLALGSIETYVMAQRTYGYPLGPKEFIHDHSNKDGLKGAAANVIRYTAGNLSTGLELWRKDAAHGSSPTWLEARCRALLSAAGLANVGYRHDYDDEKMQFFHEGWDAASDFGPVGTLGLATAILALFWWRPRETWWRLAVAGCALLCVVALTVAWMPWNNRFLLAPFSLLALSVVSLAWRPGWRWLQVPVLLLSTYAAVAYPLTSFNKRPADLVDSLVHRESHQFGERPTMLPVIASLRAWQAQHRSGEILLLAGSDSWVLPFLMESDLKVRPIPLGRLGSALETALAQNRATAVLVLNWPDFRRAPLPLAKITDFPGEADTTLYALRAPDTADQRPSWDWESGHHADGWTAPRAVLAVERWPGSTLEVKLWNPTPLLRRVQIASSMAPSMPPIELAPLERRTITVRVSQIDQITFLISPEFDPHRPDEARKLGLIIDVVLP